MPKSPVCPQIQSPGKESSNMYRIAAPLICLVGIYVSLSADRSFGQYLEEETVRAATVVLNESLASPLNQIPASMLANAHGVAIIPQVVKGSFIIGARYGRGLLFVRGQDGTWHAPVFITLTGGNVGWQLGVQSSDIILVFKTPKSVQGILAGKLTLGADAAAAAGPIGRQGAVATDGHLQAEIYSYSRSRGLFAGVSIDGSVVQVDQLATGTYYRSPGPGQPVIVPPSALQLTQMISTYAGAPQTVQAPTQNLAFAQQYGATEADLLRRQLEQIAPQLYGLLDDQWKAYLAMPSSMFLGGEHPSPAALRTTVEHFQLVATDQRFQQLASRPEFQSVHGLLKHYQQSLTSPASSLQLPPPPAEAQALSR